MHTCTTHQNFIYFSCPNFHSAKNKKTSEEILMPKINTVYSTNINISNMHAFKLPTKIESSYVAQTGLELLGLHDPPASE
jgi:hypothetical protein